MQEKNVTIKNGAIKVVFTRGSFLLFFNEKQITSSYGLYSNIAYAGHVYDSFTQTWNVDEVTDTGLRIRFSYDSLPVDEQWSMRVHEEGLSLEIDVIIKDKVRDLPYAVLCLLSDDYTRWSHAKASMSFENIMRKNEGTWKEAWVGRPEGDVIAASSDQEPIPMVCFSVDSRKIFYSQFWIGNTDYYLRSRVLRVEKMLDNLESKPLLIPAFRGTLVFKDAQAPEESLTEFLRLNAHSRCALFKTADDEEFGRCIKKIMQVNPSVRITAFVQKEYYMRLSEYKAAGLHTIDQLLYKIVPLDGYHETSFKLSKSNRARIRELYREGTRFDCALFMSGSTVQAALHHRRARLLSFGLHAQMYAIIRSGLWDVLPLKQRHYINLFLCGGKYFKIIDAIAAFFILPIVIVYTCVLILFSKPRLS